jgi:hypothetical protein
MHHPTLATIIVLIGFALVVPCANAATTFHINAPRRDDALARTKTLHHAAAANATQDDHGDFFSMLFGAHSHRDEIIATVHDARSAIEIAPPPMAIIKTSENTHE